MKNKVSVIMPAYNCQDLVGSALQSVLDQTYDNLEVLIADDGSFDRTRSVIDSFNDDRIRTFHNEENLGYLKTVNRLFVKASGDYICFQDADDWSALDRIEKQLNVLISDSLEACGTGIFYTDSKGKILKRVVYPATTSDVRMNMLKGGESACYASILFSKAILKSTGGYREFFKLGAEDVDWMLRLVEKHEFSNLDEPLYYYRFSPSSITQATNILKLKASLGVAREMALQRESGVDDFLQAGNEKALSDRWSDIYAKLSEYPLAEDLHKINALLRRNAFWECVKVCARIVRKNAPFRNKVEVIFSALIKSILGMKNYQAVKSAFSKSAVISVD